MFLIRIIEITLLSITFMEYYVLLHRLHCSGLEHAFGQL